MSQKKRQRTARRAFLTKPIQGWYVFVILAMVGVTLLAYVSGRPQFSASVLGETISSASLATPGGFTVGGYFCKNNWAWATFSWHTVSGANAYRLKFWKTTGELLHSEISESASRTTEMYMKYDTDVTVEALKRETKEGVLKVVGESERSPKLRLHASEMQNVCGSGGTATGHEDAKPEPSHAAEPAETGRTEETEQPTPKTAQTGSFENRDDTSSPTGLQEQDMNQLEERVRQLEEENTSLKEKQNILESMVTRLVDTFRRFFNF